MSEQQVKAGKVDKAEEVLDVIFPSSDEAAEVVHPGKEPLHFPAFSIAAELAAILSSAFASAPVRRNQLDAIFVLEFCVERVRVVGLVADEPCREFVEEASGKNFFNKLALGWRSALDRYGERKTVISGDSDDLGALAAAGGADGEAPFLALAKVASTNASSRFSWPCSCRCRASSRSASSSFPFADPLLESPVAGLIRRIFLRQFAPLCAGTQHPEHAIQHGPGIVPRTAAVVLPPLGRNTRSTTAHCSSVSSQRPVIDTCGDQQSSPRMHKTPLRYL